MALVLKKLVTLYYYWNDECSDPRVKDWFLMGDPIPTLAIICIYLGFVLNWGPKFMKNRKPYKLDNLIQIYNAVQVIICSYLCYEAIHLGYGRDYSLICQPVDFSLNPIPVKIAGKVYIYYNLKLLDMLDTVFFVLRKKQNQVTFLHVYHHAGMTLLTWAGTKYFPGGHGVFMGSLNSLVHVVMYSYYFLTSWNPKHKENIWWKKYITQMQIIQFLLILIHWSLLLFQPNCDYPKWPVVILVPQNLFMLVLFLDFYRRAYMKKKPGVVQNGINSNEIENETRKILTQNGNKDNVEEKLLNRKNNKLEKNGKIEKNVK